MNEHLLLVEDDDAIADVLRLHLEEAGYRLRRESDGRNAIAAIDRQLWDLVLLDLILPGADGWDVCRHLRARHADVPVIMLSARSAEAHRVLGLELGADDYLAKPFSMLQLVARVRALHGPAPGRLELDGDLQLIERALTNLIDNAMRHAPTAAPVRVSLRREGLQAQILVEDSGPRAAGRVAASPRMRPVAPRPARQAHQRRNRRPWPRDRATRGGAAWRQSAATAVSERRHAALSRVAAAIGRRRKLDPAIR